MSFVHPLVENAGTCFAGSCWFDDLRFLDHHHLGRLHHRCHQIALFQTHLIDGFTRDGRTEMELSHFDRHQTHRFAFLNRFDVPQDVKLISNQVPPRLMEQRFSDETCAPTAVLAVTSTIPDLYPNPS